jgi:hypothetical protein
MTKQMEVTAIHPAADLFPMMTADELQELASSIVENGQLQPIVLDQDGVLLDGRNRLAACKLVKFAPIFTTLPADQDPLAFIDAMDTRRNVSKGQRAMVTAFRYPESGKQGRGKNAEARKAVVSNGFSLDRLKQARSVLRHSRSLAESVLKGITPLDAALTPDAAGAAVSDHRCR